MSQQKPDAQPASTAKPTRKDGQPTPAELSAEELDRATGGDKAQTTTVHVSEIHVTNVNDKSSPNLF